MNKASAIAPSNIAFVKYMGKKKANHPDDENLAENGSISMNLSGLRSHTTVEFSDTYAVDEVILDGEQEEGEGSRVIKHLDRIRVLAGFALKARVVSNNNFPKGTGLSSSASGFAALTVAAASAAGLSMPEKDLTILSRRGSGSSCRSIPDGFVQWHAGDVSGESYARSIYPPSHWDIADVVALVSTGRKRVSTTATHAAVTGTEQFTRRMAHMDGTIQDCLESLQTKDFGRLGRLAEEEADDLHRTFEAAGIRHLTENAKAIMELARRWRQEFPVYYTVNTGQDVHLLCLQADVARVREKLSAVSFVRDIIVNHPAAGTKLTDHHLF